MTPIQVRNLTRMDQWFRYWMPYQFKKIDDEKRKHVYLPLNRDYKPLGYINARDYLDYAAFRSHAVVFSRNPSTFADVWTNHVGLYLYNDSHESRLDYFVRLDRLMSHSLKLLEKPDRRGGRTRSDSN